MISEIPRPQFFTVEYDAGTEHLAFFGRTKLLRVKERTIYAWISQGRIPVRYANGKPLFLLSELVCWTLPDNDKHSKYRLTVAQQCTISKSRLAAIRERG